MLIQEDQKMKNKLYCAFREDVIMDCLVENVNTKNFFLKLRFTPCKAEQPLQAIELQGKKAQKDYSTKEIRSETTNS